MAPWARLLAQVMFTAESANAGAKQAANKIMGKMDPGQARKILNVEKPYTAEQITQQFENIFRYNDPKVGGSYYLQCKSEHAKNVLHEELAKEWEEEMARQNAESDMNSNVNENGNDMNNNHKL